jgi:hypothetical protein
MIFGSEHAESTHSINDVFTNLDRPIARCMERLHPHTILRRNRERQYATHPCKGSVPAHGDEAMPQIWMTYGEIADLLGCTAEAARAQAMIRSLDRKSSRDGLTRVKLDSDWTGHFVAAIRDADPAADQAIRDLYTIRGEMARDAGGILRREAAAHQAEFAIKRGR